MVVELLQRLEQYFDAKENATDNADLHKVRDRKQINQEARKCLTSEMSKEKCAIQAMSMQRIRMMAYLHRMMEMGMSSPVGAPSPTWPNIEQVDEFYSADSRSIEGTE
eukprot:12742333-Ditylum_brightwellii.AAC.1